MLINRTNQINPCKWLQEAGGLRTRGICASAEFGRKSVISRVVKTCDGVYHSRTFVIVRNILGIFKGSGPQILGPQ